MAGTQAIVDALNRLIDAYENNDLDVGAITLTDLIVENVTAVTGNDLLIQGVTGKDIVMKLTDNAGARNVTLKDSDSATVFNIDSNGNIIATLLTGNVTGNLTGNSAGTHTGNVAATAANNLVLTGVATKDIVAKIGEDAGAHKFSVTDSADEEQFNIVSNGTSYLRGILTAAAGVVAPITGNLTQAGANLLITAVAAKDIVVKLGDAIGAKKLIITDSADATVASIDSNGKIIAGADATGGVTTNFGTKALSGTAPTNAEMITAFGAVASNAGAVGVYEDSSGGDKVYACVCNGVRWYAVEAASSA